MTAHDLAKEWLRSDLVIKNTVKLFEFCNNLINGIAENGNHES
jgi:hypothetical protein